MRKLALVQSELCTQVVQELRNLLDSCQNSLVHFLLISFASIIDLVLLHNEKQKETLKKAQPLAISTKNYTFISTYTST